ncbi:hypothetical protein CCGE525_35225 (plasmid) [Rhizobium jaguaris]|uniref:Uncharacterized protein n=1 Tax=Rhizobium jaguaris TaxID=1312183 RepID=A0A387G2P8_9HYPH|nr:hypothetical protein CCGE525_35225 [Rhizobium jaguaris]
MRHYPLLARIFQHDSDSQDKLFSLFRAKCGFPNTIDGRPRDGPAFWLPDGIALRLARGWFEIWLTNRWLLRLFLFRQFGQKVVNIAPSQVAIEVRLFESRRDIGRKLDAVANAATARR